jgi:tryptophan synthase alpha chain
MSRYAEMFKRCRERQEGVLGTFLMLGDPGIAECEAYLDALVEGGADMVELGIPFGDPVADGPVIQAAARRALGAGARTGECIAMIARLRARHAEVPIGVLTYANIAAARGVRRLFDELGGAGADSILLADVPSLEAEPYAREARGAGLDLVLIAAPNTTDDTVRRIARLGSGYTYCVARPGVTGADQELSLDHGRLFAALAKAGAAPPVLGFGIATPAHVGEAIAHGAAGAISGSALVERVGRGERPDELGRFVASLKAASVLDLAGAAD